MSAAGMNDRSPAPARTLVRPDRPVEVIGRQFIDKRHPVELTVSSKKVRPVGKYLEVTDVKGNIVFEIKNKVRSVHKRTFVHDADGNIMVTLRQKMRTMHGKWEVFKGEGEDELLFTGERSSAFRRNTRLHIFLPSNKTKEIPDYKIDGSWSDHGFSVSLGGSNTILAEITLLHGGELAVKVAPNVDRAFIATLVVFLGSFDPPVSLRSALRFTFGGLNIVLAVLGATDSIVNL